MTTAAILRAVGRVMLGDFDVIGWHAGHGRTVVMRAYSPAYGQVIIKVHRGGDRHRQEAVAYRCWTPALGDRAPRLIALHPDPPAIAVTALPGQPLDQVILAPRLEREAHRQAGTLLRDLHQAGPARHDPGFRAILSQRGRYWIDRAAGRLGSEQRGELLARLDELAELPVSTLTPCHLDFMARNLIRVDDGTIAVIDFEHARYDLPARDLVRLATRIWPQRPDLEEVFLDGYGPLTDLDRTVIHCCTAIDLASKQARATALGKLAPSTAVSGIPNELEAK